MTKRKPVSATARSAISKGTTSNLKPFKKGQSGNPAGRPKGSRDAISEAFLKDFAKVWKEQGIDAMQRVAKADPSTFIRVAASLIPKDVNVKGNVDHKHDHVHRAISDTAEWVTGVLRRGSSRAPAQPLPH